MLNDLDPSGREFNPMRSSVVTEKVPESPPKRPFTVIVGDSFVEIRYREGEIDKHFYWSLPLAAAGSLQPTSIQQAHLGATEPYEVYATDGTIA